MKRLLKLLHIAGAIGIVGTLAVSHLETALALWLARLGKTRDGRVLPVPVDGSLYSPA